MMEGGADCHCKLNFFRCIELSEEEIIDFFINHGILKDTMECEVSGHELSLNKRDLVFRCGRMYEKYARKKKVKCDFCKSARSGTFIERSHLSVVKIFRMVATVLFINPPRQNFLVRELSLSVKTIVDWGSFIREVLVDHMFGDGDFTIGGRSHIAEVRDVENMFKSKYESSRMCAFFKAAAKLYPPKY